MPEYSPVWRTGMLDIVLLFPGKDHEELDDQNPHQGKQVDSQHEEGDFHSRGHRDVMADILSIDRPDPLEIR